MRLVCLHNMTWRVSVLEGKKTHLLLHVVFCFFCFEPPQEAAWSVTDECIQVMGGMGFMKVSLTSCLINTAQNKWIPKCNLNVLYPARVEFFISLPKNTFKAKMDVYTAKIYWAQELIIRNRMIRWFKIAPECFPFYTKWIPPCVLWQIKSLPGTFYINQDPLNKVLKVPGSCIFSTTGVYRIKKM